MTAKREIRIQKQRDEREENMLISERQYTD
jgi:hypothetical protein